MFRKHRSDVLVVGAGPVGLFTAICLTDQGAKVEIVDKHRRTGTHSYALALHPRSLELLEAVGLADTLIAHGHRVERVGFYRDGRHMGDVSLRELGCRHSFALVLPQSALEMELEEQLRRRKVKVQWNHRLEGVREEDEAIIAQVARLDQVASGYPIARVDWAVTKTYDYHSRFVVGADGYQSRLRSELGIEFRQLGELRTFSVYEFEVGRDPGHEMRVVFDDDLTSVLWPMKSNRCRWSFEIEAPERHVSDRDRLNALIRERAPWFPKVVGEIHWSSMCQFDRRLASAMGRGRGWLAGDSAHLTSPVGVQSMNAGLIDAFELSELVGEMLRNEEWPNLLDSYERQRMRDLRRMLGVDPLPVATSPGATWPAADTSRILTSIPATGDHLETLLTQLGLERTGHVPS